MKKIMQRFFGVLTSVALLVTSATPVFATSASEGHEHNGGTPIDDTAGCDYTITLTHSDGKTTFGTDSHYGAYQIFFGVVEGTNEKNPGGASGTESFPISITDIKWGNAFGDVNDPSKQEAYYKAIISFVYALSKAPDGDYDYAFKDFHGFEGFFDINTLDNKYVKDVAKPVTVTVGASSTNVENLDNVNFDKLAVAVAEVLADPKHIDDHEWLQAFTDILGGYAQGTDGEYKESGYVSRYYEGKPKTGETTKYEIQVPAGYYMIRDLSKVTAEGSSFSARMLFVANNVEQVLKEDVPTLDKTILRDGDKAGDPGKETEVAGVGDVVHFQLTGTLPGNYDLYLGGYQYTFEDTLSDGLDLVQHADDHADYSPADNANNCVNVTVKGLFKWVPPSIPGEEGTWAWQKDETITLDAAWTEITDPNGAVPDDHHLGKDSGADEVDYNYKATYDTTNRKLTVEFPCLKEIRIQKGSDIYRLGYDTESSISSDIYVDYYAKVNENAVVSPAEDSENRNGNQNQAQIKYSDNPQSYDDTDYTTVDNATVYIFGLGIIKIDAAEFLKNDGKAEAPALLGGAQFVMLRKNPDTAAVNKWQIAKFDWVAPSTDATLPKSFQANGYNTIFEWEDIVGSTADDYKSCLFNDDGTLKSEYSSKYNNTLSAQYYNITSLSNGALNISGLDVGVEYTIVETVAPDDYARIDPFTVTLTAVENSGEYTGELSAATSDGQKTDPSFSFKKPVNVTGLTYAEGSAHMLVANFKYIDLPSTGGVGTYLFYIIGGGIVVLSAVLFIFSKKKTTK